jgi:hypothetical protein
MGKNYLNETEVKDNFKNIRWTRYDFNNFNKCLQELELIVNSSEDKNTIYIGHASTLGGQVFFDKEFKYIDFVEGSDYARISADNHKKLFNHQGIDLVKIPIPEAFKEKPHLDYIQKYMEIAKLK